MPLLDVLENEQTEQIQEINRISFAQKWNWINTSKLAPSLRNTAHRLNALGDNYYFIKVILRKHRLSDNFHRQYCNELMCWSLKEVFEVPRDHFKTTIGSVGMPIWWALPFTSNDEKYMRLLGYGDEFISWMQRAHDQNTRTLIAMEVIKNAWKVGKKISYEYNNNDFFMKLFPEIKPDSSCQWTADTMTHKRDHTRSNANQGEGTYEFTGVDAALQSKHYNRLVFDDLFGKEALKSEVVQLSTWEWFQLAVGAFDSSEGDPDSEPDEIVNGNRWSFHDLDWKIRKELPYFRFHTHSAEGGCCTNHPAGIPIFPEEWSIKKLARMRERLGDYFYSCQFLNKPIPPGGNVFKSEWLRYFVYRTINIESVVPGFKSTDLALPMSDMGTFGTEAYKIIPHDTHEQKRHKAIRHQTNNGLQAKDIPTSNLSKMLLVDPNHAGEKGRANNVILVLGVNHDPLNIYLLDGYANNCSREDAVYQMYKLGEQWRIRTIWVEISAGQTWLKTLLEFENKTRKSLGKWYFYDVKNFKDNRSENAKGDRIEDTEPYFRRGQVWINTYENAEFTNKFIEEYNEYPHCATRDILDTLGHGLQNLEQTTMSEKEMRSFVYKQEQRMKQLQSSRSSITGY
jgi:hypothetical protein